MRRTLDRLLMASFLAAMIVRWPLPLLIGIMASAPGLLLVSTFFLAAWLRSAPFSIPVGVLLPIMLCMAAGFAILETARGCSLASRRERRAARSALRRQGHG